MRCFFSLNAESVYRNVAEELPAGGGNCGGVSSGEGMREGIGKLTAVTTWSAVHGLMALLLEGQIPHAVLEQFSLRQMLIFSLNQLCGPRFSFDELPPSP
jgi:hypothetical protein